MTDSDAGNSLEDARAAVARNPADSRGYRRLASVLRHLDLPEDAALADADAIQTSARSPLLLEAAHAMRCGRVETAEHLLRTCLESDPDDPQALRMLAEIAAVCGHGGDAERLLRRAVEAAPGFVPLYVNLAALLHDLGRVGEAISLLDEVLTSTPGNLLVLSFKAEILAASGAIGEALRTHEELVTRAPTAAVVWLNYGHLLKAAGQGEAAFAAYRKAVELDPVSGFAWWGLADLKRGALDCHDIAALEKALAAAGDDASRIQLHFALGRALGDQERFEESFSQYVEANKLRRACIPCELSKTEKVVQQVQTLVTRDFLQKLAEQGVPAVDPIFIIGLPRSGSTLVEQILAGHPLVEGAGELIALESIATALERQAGVSWPDAMGQLTADALRSLGDAYLAATRSARRTNRPFFTDKMPYNWLYTAFILCILPNAKIIDVRRHPMGCCFSNFAMYFNRATNFASGLEDIGRYYCAYVRMMDHIDRFFPGRVCRVLYEDLVADVEGEVRRLLDHLGLPFDSACLQFYDNPRAVHTPSAEQVRKPIFREGLERWRNYEPWLGPLAEALKEVLD